LEAVNEKAGAIVRDHEGSCLCSSPMAITGIAKRFFRIFILNFIAKLQKRHSVRSDKLREEKQPIGTSKQTFRPEVFYSMQYALPLLLRLR